MDLESNSEPLFFGGKIPASLRGVLVDSVVKQLEVGNLEILAAAYHLPDKGYEACLLEFDDKIMTEPQKIYWMLSLGRLSSTPAFERIFPYINTRLFHQAFVAMADIDLGKTMLLLDTFLDNHCHEYTGRICDSRHNSGFNTLATILEEHSSAKELVMAYGISENCEKTVLINDCLAKLGSGK